MKKYLSILIVAIFLGGFVSCTPENSVSEEEKLTQSLQKTIELETQSSDKDEEPDDQDPDA